MRFFRLIDNVRIPGRWHLGEVVDQSSQLPMELWKGFPVETRMPPRLEITNVGKPLQFCLTSFAVPIATSSLAKAVAQVANGDVQRIPVSIEGHEGFEVLNSIRMVKCLDEGSSEFTKWTENENRPDLVGQFRMVTKLKIHSKLVPADASFFRIEGWPIALIVSERVKKIFEEAGCLGAIFQDVL